MPMSGSWDGGKRVAGAAALAAERVNADEALLPGQRLEYSWADSGCSAQQGLEAMGKLLSEAHRIYAVIGPWSSLHARMQLCMRGDELLVCWAENPSDQLGMHCFCTLEQEEIRSGAAGCSLP